MKKCIYKTIVFLTFLTSGINAQEKKWTLEDCINYALANNLNLQRQKLLTETAEVNYLKSKLDLLPSLSAGTDVNIGFGRSVNPVTNMITFEQNLSNAYSVSSSVNLFSGFYTINTLQANKFLIKAGVESEKIAQNSLIADILGQYYQVIYTKGLEETAKIKLEQSERQLFRITKMVETGTEALSMQYEMESRVSADRLDYTIAKGNSNTALTMLKQILQIGSGSSFDIAVPDMNTLIIEDTNYNADSVYSIASQILPRLRSIEYELMASKKQVAASKGLASPKLSAGGSIYTGYYNVMNAGSNDNAEQQSFNTQIKNNNSQTVWVSLSIPLFSNYTTGKTIRLAKIKKDDTVLKLELEKNILYAEIENACLDYNKGKDEFLAAASNLEYNRKSFAAVEKKFESGLIDVTDYSAAKTTLFTAETELIRTKLQAIIRNLAIQLYSTGNYQNLSLNQ